MEIISRAAITANQLPFYEYLSCATCQAQRHLLAFVRPDVIGEKTFRVYVIAMLYVCMAFFLELLQRYTMISRESGLEVNTRVSPLQSSEMISEGSTVTVAFHTTKSFVSTEIELW